MKANETISLIAYGVRSRHRQIETQVLKRCSQQINEQSAERLSEFYADVFAN